LSLTSQQKTDQDPVEETTSQDSNLDIAPKTPTSKSGAMGSLLSTGSPSLGSGTPEGPNPAVTPNAVRPFFGGPSVAAILSSPVAIQGVAESTAPPPVSPSLVNSVNSVTEDDTNTFPGRRPSPAIPEIGVGRGVSRGISNQASVTTSMSSASGISSNGAIGPIPAVSDTTKRNILSVDERIGSGSLTPPLVSPLSNRMLLQQVSKSNDGQSSNDTNSIGESPVIGGRVFSPSVTTGVQWRPPSSAAFQNQNEMVCSLLPPSVSLVCVISQSKLIYLNCLFHYKSINVCRFYLPFSCVVSCLTASVYVLCYLGGNLKGSYMYRMNKN